jgi:hypothetical protein
MQKMQTKKRPVWLSQTGRFVRLEDYSELDSSVPWHAINMAARPQTPRSPNSMGFLGEAQQIVSTKKLRTS